MFILHGDRLDGGGAVTRDELIEALTWYPSDAEICISVCSGGKAMSVTDIEDEKPTATEILTKVVLVAEGEW